MGSEIHPSHIVIKDDKMGRGRPKLSVVELEKRSTRQLRNLIAKRKQRGQDYYEIAKIIKERKEREAKLREYGFILDEHYMKKEPATRHKASSLRVGFLECIKRIRRYKSQKEKAKYQGIALLFAFKIRKYHFQQLLQHFKNQIVLFDSKKHMVRWGLKKEHSNLRRYEFNETKNIVESSHNWKRHYYDRYKDDVNAWLQKTISLYTERGVKVIISTRWNEEIEELIDSLKLGADG